MVAPREVVASPVPWTSLPATAAWLMGYVRTDVPGSREIQIDTSLFVVASSTGYRFDDLIDAINTAISPAAVTWSTTTGAVTSVGTEIYPDRLGWVLGLGVEAGETPSYVAASSLIPPAGIPLMGATWETVTVEADRRQIIDRHRRNQGYVWGSGAIWRCQLTMHRWSLQALETGWCLRGKVTLAGTAKLDTPVSTSEPAGAITGYVLGLDSVEWLDRQQTVARVVLSIVTD